MKFLLFLGLVVLFPGCRKLYDAINHNASKTNCRINTVTDYVSGHNTITPRIATVKYNSDGNPVQVSYDRRETGYGWAFLKYDKYQRIIELNEENNALHKYVYEGYAAQPVRDTLTALVNPVIFIDHFTYDNKNRIINVKRKFFYSEFGETYPDTETSYSYNAQENLIGPYTYDNKVNVYSTHRVWMFLFRNYSVNNIATAVSYNNKNLPLDFTGTGAPGMNFFEGTFNGAQITYTCK